MEQVPEVPGFFRYIGIIFRRFITKAPASVLEVIRHIDRARGRFSNNTPHAERNNNSTAVVGAPEGLFFKWEILDECCESLFRVLQEI